MGEFAGGGAPGRGFRPSRKVVGKTGHWNAIHRLAHWRTHAGIIRPELPKRWQTLSWLLTPGGMVAIPAGWPSLLPLVDHSPVNLFAPTPVRLG